MLTVHHRLFPVDSILTRMGAYDNMFSNASTFKVELDEWYVTVMPVSVRCAQPSAAARSCGTRLRSHLSSWMVSGAHLGSLLVELTRVCAELGRGTSTYVRIFATSPYERVVLMFRRMVWRLRVLFFTNSRRTRSR